MQGRRSGARFREIPYSGRHGIAYGTSLPQMLADAEEALFQIDQVLQELGVVV